MNELEKMQLRTALYGFTGSEYFNKHWTGGGCYTDGVKYLAEHANCYWLLDKIFTLQRMPSVGKEEFQVWTLEMLPESMAVLKCDNGNDNIVYQEHIQYTDFPLSEGISLYYENKTLCLPQER